MSLTQDISVEYDSEAQCGSQAIQKLNEAVSPCQDYTACLVHVLHAI